MATRKKIKVLQCIRQGEIGGGESHLLSLLENLDRSVFEPVVLSFTDGPMIERLKKSNVESHVIYTETPFDIRKWAKVKKLLKEKKADLIHVHGTRANSNIFWAARSLGIPVIYTVHGWSFHDDQHPFIRNLKVSSERYLTSKASVNISVSDSNRQSGKKLMKNFESIVINNGIDQNKFSPARPSKDIRAELSIPANAMMVLFLARLTVQKQPLLLLKAFKQAIISNPDLHLLIVGDGDLEKECKQLARTLDITGNVTFQSFRHDVPDVLAAADIFVLPSLWEGLSIGLLEAMAMGKAVIATNVDGTTEVIQHNQNGLLVEPGNAQQLTDAILHLSNDYGLRNRLQKNAVQTIQQRFSADHMTRQIETIYKSLFDKKYSPNKIRYMEFERIADFKRLKFIKDTLTTTIPAGADVLDVGCGNGVISRSLGEQGFTVTGIDVSEKAIAKAKQLNTLPNVRFDVIDAEQLVADRKRFHAVICSEVLEHLEDPGRLLKVLHQTLHNNGVLIVTVPNGNGPRELLVTRPINALQKKNNFAWHIVRKMKSLFGYNGTTVQSSADDLTHVQFFTKTSLERLAYANNFKIVKFGKTNFIEDVFPFSFFTKKIKVLQKLDCAFADQLPHQLTGGFVTVWQKTG